LIKEVDSGRGVVLLPEEKKKFSFTVSLHNREFKALLMMFNLKSS